MESGKPIIAIIVPCYNEEEVLPETIEKLLKKILFFISKCIISKKSSLFFIDDGSRDNTWTLIEKYHAENPYIFNGIKLSKNKGHQNTLLCGLFLVKNCVDAAITIDADLQDDIEAIDRMIEKYLDGYEIVNGVRSSREADHFLKRVSAQGFYRFMQFLGVDIEYNHADFRLMGKNALEALSQYNEVNFFLRGIVPMLGFKTCAVYYDRKERLAGKSKYPLPKMLKFAIEGITSFSIKPIRLISIMGVLLFTISLIMIVYFFSNYFSDRTISGWASIICSLWGIGGLILFSIGIVGEYIGKIYLETKQRPKYHIEQFLAAKEFINNL